jgi:hypothetical protein
LTAKGLDFSGGFVHLILVAGRGDNIGASIGQAKTEGVSDAGGPANDNRDFSFKTKQITHEFSIQLATDTFCAARHENQCPYQLWPRNTGAMWR